MDLNVLLDAVLEFLHLLPRAVPAWKDRVHLASHGNTVWPAPCPGKNALVGAPLEWLAAVADPSTDSGIRYLSVPCQCGCKDATPLTMDYSARCARCGIPLDLRHAAVKHSFDVPSCPKCRTRVKRLVGG